MLHIHCEILLLLYKCTAWKTDLFLAPSQAKLILYDLWEILPFTFFCFHTGPHAETASGCQNLQCGFRACCRSGEWPLTPDLCLLHLAEQASFHALYLKHISCVNSPMLSVTCFGPVLTISEILTTSQLYSVVSLTNDVLSQEGLGLFLRMRTVNINFPLKEILSKKVC